MSELQEKLAQIKEMQAAADLKKKEDAERETKLGGLEEESQRVGAELVEAEKAATEAQETLLQANAFIAEQGENLDQAVKAELDALFTEAKQVRERFEKIKTDRDTILSQIAELQTPSQSSTRTESTLEATSPVEEVLPRQEQDIKQEVTGAQEKKEISTRQVAESVVSIVRDSQRGDITYGILQFSPNKLKDRDPAAAEALKDMSNNKRKLAELGQEISQLLSSDSELANKGIELIRYDGAMTVDLWTKDDESSSRESEDELNEEVPRNSVETSQERITGKVNLKWDFTNSMFMADSSGNGEVNLTQNSNTGALEIRPRIDYFDTKQDYYNYYDKFYDYENPQRGEVEADQPAIVERDQDGRGFKIVRKGTLRAK